MYGEYGLSGALFAMLDVESDEILRKGIKDTLTSILAVTFHDKTQLQSAIALCKSILTCGMSFIYSLTTIKFIDEILNGWH